MQPDDHDLPAGAILSSGEGDEPLEAWTPQEFDHFADLELARRDLSGDYDRFD